MAQISTDFLMVSLLTNHWLLIIFLSIFEEMYTFNGIWLITVLTVSFVISSKDLYIRFRHRNSIVCPCVRLLSTAGIGKPQRQLLSRGTTDPIVVITTIVFNATQFKFLFTQWTFDKHWTKTSYMSIFSTWMKNVVNFGYLE